MKHQIIFRAAASATLTMGLLAGTNQVVADPLIDALSQGKVSANIRLRYEGVDDDTRSKDADAVTIRTRLGYQTADFNGWKLFGEIEDVTALDESYNSTVNGKGTYPVVADPRVSSSTPSYRRRMLADTLPCDSASISGSAAT